MGRSNFDPVLKLYYPWGHGGNPVKTFVTPLCNSVESPSTYAGYVGCEGWARCLNHLVKTVSHMSWAAGQASEMEGWSGVVIWEALNYDEHCTVVVVIPLPP